PIRPMRRRAPYARNSPKASRPIPCTAPTASKTRRPKSRTSSRMTRLSASPLAVYIHWPFCRSKCPYCDFNSHVAANVDHAVWRRAYRRELEYYAALLPDRHVTSVFFGGGTPSLMEAETVAAVLQDIARLWPVDAEAEITLEANPNSAEAGKFAAFRAAG